MPKPIEFLVRMFPPLGYANIPNMITTMGFVFGAAACHFILVGDLRMGIIVLFFAGVMDLVDGWFAMKLNQSSVFGKHVDTLVDFFTCCVVPFLMVFSLIYATPVMVAGLFTYGICGLWRLSGYNITQQKGFRGLPVPCAMMCVTIAVWFVVMHEVSGWVLTAVFFGMSLLMISGIPLAKYGVWQKVTGGIGLGFFLWVVIWG